MKRANLLAHPPWEGPRFDRAVVTPALRPPLLALCSISLVIASLSVVGEIRCTTAESARRHLETRLAASNLALRSLKALQEMVERDERISEHIITVQRSSLGRANELALIGNRLPRDMRLSRLRYDAGTYRLEGTSANLTSIGLAMTALRDPAIGSRHPELRSIVRGSADRDAADIRYALDLQGTIP